MAATESMEMSREDLIAKDLPEYLALLAEFKTIMSEIMPSITSLRESVGTEEMRTKEGISFLEMKFHLLLNYIINLLFVMFLKLDGKSIDGAPVIERLVEIRTVLERIRPIDQRLKYQIDKLVKLASKGESVDPHDPLSFKPNPENMSSKIDDEEVSSEEENQKNGVYVPPRVAAVPYEEDTLEGQRKKFEERAKVKSLNKSLIKDLREEYSETPEEIKEDYKSRRGARDEEKEIDKERYEEENLIRLSHGKKSKAANKRENSTKDLSQFGSFGFGSDDEDDNDKRKSKKSKFSIKGKKKKGKFAFKKKRKFKK